jgi:4-hydroxythreonine-4-phosphate dehydrogenase
MAELAPLALTMGEPAGIGGDIALAAWLARQDQGLPCFFVIDDAGRLERLAGQLSWPVPICPIGEPAQARQIWAEGLPVLHRALPAPAEPGRPDRSHADAFIGAIGLAVRLAGNGQAGAVVTNPIHKATLYQAGFAFPGHTEFLAHLAIMMLACPGLRVVPVSIHVSLRRAIAELTSERIVAAGRITAAALISDFGIAAPRLVVAGLNPHAGEAGGLGTEDRDIIAPAVAELRTAGIDANGPFAADSLFHAEARARYDAVLCMYHDQALIPLKTLDFYRGVNITLGLPWIRTSPDHGTAFELAGTGLARPDSLIAALKLAAEMAARRG